MFEGHTERWSKNREFGVRIRPEVIRTILETCQASGRVETGGILVGKYSDDRRLATVYFATRPSLDSRRGTFWLIRGVRGLHGWLKQLWKDDGGYYVGEWHFHPFAPPTPSSQDLEQMRRIATTKSYQCADPLLIILGGDPNGEWAMHVEVHTSGGERYVLGDETTHDTARS